MFLLFLFCVRLSIKAHVGIYYVLTNHKGKIKIFKDASSLENILFPFERVGDSNM